MKKFKILFLLVLSSIVNLVNAQTLQSFSGDYALVCPEVKGQ